MAFTEFYVQPTGSNLNAGSTTSDAAAFTYAAGTFVRSTGVFTVASGNPLSDGVTAGMFASIYTTADATVATCVGRITARDATTITISLTALAGATTAVSEGEGEATCKVGGAWAGPSGAVGFPFGFVLDALNDGTLPPRVNFKGGTAYEVTAQITNGTGGVVWQGYTAAPGDGGKATIDGGESGAAYLLFLSSANQNTYIDLIWAHNGASGGSSATPGVSTTAARTMYLRCVVYGMRAAGWNSNSNVMYLSCEAYDCNRQNLSSTAGFHMTTSGGQAHRCYSHHHAGSNANGFFLDQTVLLLHCIAAQNGNAGFYSGSDQMLTLLNCDAYANGGHGIATVSVSATLVLNVQNCNLIDNGGYGFFAGATGRFGIIANCGVGAGTAANASGAITADLAPVVVTGTVTYPDDVTPWVDPANGDFRLNRAEARGTGRGVYTQTDTSQSQRATVGYPDIGAADSRHSGTRFFSY